MKAELAEMGVQAIAFSQEDTDLKSHAKFLKHFSEGGPSFPILADLERGSTPAWDRTTTYYIDEEGVVQQIFPMIIHGRASWRPILNEVKRLRAADK